MRPGKALLLCVAFSLLLPVAARAEMPVKADMIDNLGRHIGVISIQQGPEGLLLGVDLGNLPPGPHGFHVHSIGDCSDHDHFKNAAGHVRGSNDQHGLLNPEGPEAGDLPNLIVHSDGTVRAEIYAPGLTIGGHAGNNIVDADGSAFMVHANADDHRAQPIGGAGDRIACGVIKISE